METITLDYPVTIDGRQTNELRMRRPKVRDQLTVDKSTSTNSEKEVRLFSNLCEVPPAVIEDLDLLDYNKLLDTYRGFLSSRPPT